MAAPAKLPPISIQGGGVSVPHVRDLRGTVEREEAAIGVFVCIEPPTKAMVKEAAEAAFYTSPAGTQHPRLQVLTIEDLLNGKKLDSQRGTT